MSKQRATREYSGWALNVDEQGMRRLYDELLSIVGAAAQSSIRFNVQYSDKSAVEAWSLEDLLADENRSFRRIKTIAVHASGDQHEILLRIGTKKKVKDHDEEQFVGTVLLDVSAPDRQRVFVVQSLIEDRIKSFRVNRPAAWVFLLGGLLLVLIVVFALSFVLGPYLPTAMTEPNRSTGNIEVRPVIVLAVALFGAALSTSTLWLFPDLEFLLGRGIERHERLERLKTNLFWVVLVGAVVGLITGIAVSRFT